VQWTVSTTLRLSTTVAMAPAPFTGAAEVLVDNEIPNAVTASNARIVVRIFSSLLLPLVARTTTVNLNAA
jgi:hypothetical protein